MLSVTGVVQAAGRSLFLVFVAGMSETGLYLEHGFHSERAVMGDGKMGASWDQLH